MKTALAILPNSKAAGVVNNLNSDFRYNGRGFVLRQFN